MKKINIYRKNIDATKAAMGIPTIPVMMDPPWMNPNVTAKEMATIEPIGHIWTTGDRLYKLAEKYYNDPTLWWVIAWYNNRPTEGHFKVGDVIQIPTPIERVYGLMRM